MSSYSDYANAAASIIQHQGDLAAEAARRKGQFWGGTLASLGQIPQQFMEQQQHAKEFQARQQAQQQEAQLRGAELKLKEAELNRKDDPSIAEERQLKSAQLRHELAARLLINTNKDNYDIHKPIIEPILGTKLPDEYPGDETIKAWSEQGQSVKEQLDAKAEALKAAKTPPDKLVPIPGPDNKPVYGVPKEGQPVYEKPPAESQGRNPTEASLAFDSTSPDPAVSGPAKEALKTLRQQQAAGRPPVDTPTRVEHKDPITGKTVIEYIPRSQLAGRQFDKGTPSIVENRIASAVAVQQTGDDIIAQLNDPKVKAMLGPAMGRFNTLRDFIGNPPPELSDLAGSIESYSLANMGVHGMRSVQGSEQIKKLLDQHHTPESLIRTIQGLNRFSQHFIENEGRSTGTTPPPASTGTNPTGLSYSDYLKAKGKP